MLYPNWSNASEYNTVAIHSLELDVALKKEWDNRINQQAVKLTSDQRYLCLRMGIPLPFLPFTTEEDESKVFAECALRWSFQWKLAISEY